MPNSNSEIVDEQLYKFANWCEQWYHTSGNLPDEQTALAVGFLAPSYRRWITDAWLNSALKERGIATYLDRDIEGNSSAVLTAQQLNAVTVMLDLNDHRPRSKKLADLKIKSSTYESWLRDPVFNNYIRTRGENLLSLNGHDARASLLSRVRAGDLGAIKYFDEITGRYVPDRGKGVDIQTLILQVVEVIQKEVPDTAVQQRISAGLLELMVKATGGTYEGKPIIPATLVPNAARAVGSVQRVVPPTSEIGIM